MSKPRVFIGSSVEGLQIAYAVQQNLLHQAEVTVWDQGIFELSRTTIESLTQALDENDFAVFVFSPDDITKLRNTTSPTVRDNVIFEFGLFIGKLSRERVFFLVPNTGEIHLPTDLLGITPGKYETDRSDNSLQAATGAASNQIRTQIKNLGIHPSRMESEVQSLPETEKSVNPEERSWISDYLEKKFSKAKEKLAADFAKETGEDALCTQVFMLGCDLGMRGDDDITELLAFATKNESSVRAIETVAILLRSNGHTQEAINVLTSAAKIHSNDPDITRAIASCHRDVEDHSSAIAALKLVAPENSPAIAIELAEALEKEDKRADALEVIRRCYMRHPSNEAVRYKYARLAADSGEAEIALALTHRLTIEFPGQSDYWGYFGNACHHNGLTDKALVAYRRAESTVKPYQNGSWISSNIANLAINVGLPSEAIEPLKRAIDLDSQSDYAHDRMASAIKKIKEQQKQFEEAVARGVRKIKEAEAVLRFATAAANNAQSRDNALAIDGVDYSEKPNNQ